MSAHNVKVVAAFIAAHPGCTVSEVERGVPIRDAAATWALLIDAERAGAITMEHTMDGGGWHLYAAEAGTR